jgi:phosphate starvation-inducible protein PhoH
VVRHKLVGRIVAAYDKFEADTDDALRPDQGVVTPQHRSGR